MLFGLISSIEKYKSPNFEKHKSDKTNPLNKKDRQLAMSLQWIVDFNYDILVK